MPSRPYVSVKFTPAGRTVSFLLPEIVIDEESPSSDPPAAGATAAGPLPDDRSPIPGETLSRLPATLTTLY